MIRAAKFTAGGTVGGDGSEIRLEALTAPVLFYLIVSALTSASFFMLTGMTERTKNLPAAIERALRGRLVQTLLENDLVDGLRLMVFPTVLGTGNRVFDEYADRTEWELAEAKPVYAGANQRRRAGRYHAYRSVAS